MKNRVLFIGLTTIDIQYFLDIFPLPNTKHKAEAPLLAAGGPAANAAITYAKLGGLPDFVTCIGKNNFTSFLLSDLKINGLNVIDALKETEYQPIVASIITNITNSDRTILTHHPEKISFNSQNLNIDISNYDFVFIDGFYPEIAIPLCQQAQKAGIEIILDGGSWKPQIPTLLPYVDTAICSANFFPPQCSTYNETIDYMLSKGVKNIAITRGGESIVSNQGEITVEKVEAIDSLGAGDILHGAFTWFYSQKTGFVDALKKSSTIATRSTLTKGTRTWNKNNLPI